MRLFKKRKKKKSGNIAKERIQFLLIHERADLNPQLVNMIKNEILNVIDKYLIIDKDGMQIELSSAKVSNGRAMPAIVANLPIKGVRKK